MSLEKPSVNFKLKVLLLSRTKEQLMKVIQDYNDYCKANNLKDNMLKGYSQKPYNTKEGLVDFLIERLSDEEKEAIFQKVAITYIEDLFKQAIEYLRKENQREKLETIATSKNEVKLKFKGWQWENEISLDLSPDGTLTSYTCSCKTGQKEGFCPHLFTGIATLIKQNTFNQNAFPFKLPESSLKELQQVPFDSKEFEDLDTVTAQIVLGDDYFISVDGNLVTLKWGGDRPGKTTKDTSAEEKAVPVEVWVAEKVVDKILAPLRDNPRPREIFKDDFGVIPVILANEKLTNKLLKKFTQVNETQSAGLPSTKEELEKFLKMHL